MKKMLIQGENVISVTGKPPLRLGRFVPTSGGVPKHLIVDSKFDILQLNTKYISQICLGQRVKPPKTLGN
jgi:hypothetical protein